MSPVATSHGVAFETSRSEVDQLDLGVVDVACHPKQDPCSMPAQTQRTPQPFPAYTGCLAGWFISSLMIVRLVGWSVGRDSHLQESP